MKKRFLLFYCLIFCLLLGGFTSLYNSPVYAIPDGLTVGLAATVEIEGTSIEVGQDGFYHTQFTKNTETPYRTFTVSASVSTSPTNWYELSSTDQQEILSLIKWQVNGYELDFTSSNTVEISNFKAVKNNLKLEFTASAAGSYIITISVEGQQQTAIANLMCDYYIPPVNVPSNINSLTATTGSLAQVYENYQEVTLHAELRYKEFLNPNTNYTYEWYIGSVEDRYKIKDANTCDLVIPKNMIKIETMTFIVVVKRDGISVGEKSANLVITTNQQLAVVVTYTGATVQRLGSTEQLDFEVSVPVSDNYTVYWLVGNADNGVYAKQETNEETFSLDMSKYTTEGTYRVFSKVVIKGTPYYSNIVEIKLQKKIVENVVFEITQSPYNNNKTGVQGFDLSINTSDYYNENEIVWIVNGTAVGIGSSIKFNPELSNQYYVEARLIDENGKIVKTGQPLASAAIDAQPTPLENTWIIYVSAGLLVLLLSVLSIVISNVKREKIW